MPTREEKQAVLKRDGYHCRFCGIPVIPPEVRKRVRRLYSHALQWGPRNKEQHAAFQAMWLQFDHLVPHSRGGTNSVENLLITCAPCNFGRMEHTLEEEGVKFGASPQIRSHAGCRPEQYGEPVGSAPQRDQPTGPGQSHRRRPPLRRARHL